MRSVRLLVAALTVGIGAIAGFGPGRAEAAPTSRIAGVTFPGAAVLVVDDGTGAASPTVIAGADGSFALGNLEPGRRVVEVVPPPNFDWFYRFWPHQTHATFQVDVPADSVATFDPVLTPGTVVGRVTTSIGPFPPQTLTIVATNAYGERFTGFLATRRTRCRSRPARGRSRTPAPSPPSGARSRR